MIWADKYSPHKFTELLFSTGVHFEALKWIKNWSTDSQILVLAGPTGHSKSLLIQILSKLTQRRLFTLTPHSFKNENYAYSASNMRSLRNEDSIILIEDVDDSLLKDLIKNKKKYKVPIVLTLLEKYNSLLLNKEFYVLEVKRLTTNLVIKRINEISKFEGITFNQRDLLNFIEKSNCDLRSILNILQVYKKCVNLSKIKVKNTFQVINDILNGELDSLDDISAPVLSLIHNNFLENSDLNDAYEVYELFSLCDTLPQTYNFLPCTKLRCKKISFLPAKNYSCDYSKRKDHKFICHKILPYFNLIKNDLRYKDYLLTVNEKYKIKENYFMKK